LNTRKPDTYITRILNNFQENFEWGKYCNGFDKETGLPINLILPYDKNHITFHFVANSLSAPEKVLYKYMMEGIDTSWTPPMAINEAIFATLPPGKFTFKVKACNNDGIWNEIPTSYSFEISPPWYLSLWFIIPLIIVIIILIFAFIKYREAALRRDKLRLEKTVTERTSEVVHQKEIVEQKNKDITDSINYAKNIQEALLPTRAEIGKHFPESFILYKPRDIVSGDFYWISHRNNRTYYAIADCTGHGVPGAFMSMLGIAFLDEVIGMNPEIESNELLNQLRQNVILSLRQTGEAGQSKDGMDINLIVVDWEKKILEYSGANNPLYLIRNSYLTEYKGDKMPIGVHINKEPFSINRIPFSLGDSIYMFSDGYADQFGGPHNKKFKYKSLKELLIKISNQPMVEQGKILNKTIEEWKGDNSQLDDIIVAGIHFGKITISL
jgi:serine phosphatase RsbU (regulator of sigma subunit)